MKNQKLKKIGIVAWSTGDNSFGATKPYLHFFSKFGIVRLILPQETEIIEDLDLLVLPGGRDVDPGRYSNIPGFHTGYSDVYLEHFDKSVLPKYIDNKTPIFGICRGLQTLNVHFGGSLIQHLSNHPYSSSREDLVHIVKKNEENIKSIDYISSLSIVSDSFKTNSLHHQAINRIGKDLLPILNCKSYGKTIEAIAHKELPIAAVQYHPEEIHDTFSICLINCLLNYKNVEIKNIELCIS